MKIIYIYTGLVTKGGADRILSEKANYLAEHGYEVAFVTDTQLGRPPIYPLSEKVRIIDLAIDFSQEYGHGLLMRAFMYFRLMRQYKKKLKETLLHEKADIVISTLGRDMDILTSIHDGSIKIAESHIAKPFVRNFHLMEQRGFPYRQIAHYWRHKQERNVSQLKALVLLTQRDADAWSPFVNTEVIPNSLPFEEENISTCMNKQAICVGRLNEQKGLDFLIDAWELVTRLHPDWTLNIYGAGELKEELQQRIDSKHLQRNIIINAPTTDIKEKYLESSIYLMTSRFEGFPMVLLEAMECGLPCVAFDCPNGPAEIISHGRNGYITPYKDTNTFATHVCKLIENEKLRCTMGLQAKKDIKRYKRENIMRQWESLFCHLINPELTTCAQDLQLDDNNDGRSGSM